MKLLARRTRNRITSFSLEFFYDGMTSDLKQIDLLISKKVNLCDILHTEGSEGSALLVNV